MPKHPPNTDGSYLVEETDSMMFAQRHDEQDGKALLGKVHRREHQEKLGQTNSLASEATQDQTPSHPDLQSQLYDGMDPNLNIDPTNNPIAKIDLENELREQQLEHQKQLGLQPGHKFTLKPPGAV